MIFTLCSWFLDSYDDINKCIDCWVLRDAKERGWRVKGVRPREGQVLQAKMLRDERVHAKCRAVQIREPVTSQEPERPSQGGISIYWTSLNVLSFGLTKTLWSLIISSTSGFFSLAQRLRNYITRTIIWGTQTKVWFL